MTQTAQLRRQLKARDLDAIHSGLSDIDAEAAAALLADVSATEGRLVLGRTFESGAEAEPYRTYAVMRLLEVVRSPLLGELTALALAFQRTEPGELDVGFLEQMSSLRSLTLQNAAGLSALPPLPTLRRLVIRGASGLDLGAVLGVPLEELHIEGPPLDASALSTLRAQPALERLTIEGCAGLTAISELPPASELTVRGCPDLADVSALQTTMLRQLHLAASVEVVTIDDAPLLNGLHIEGPRLEGALRAEVLASLRCERLPDPSVLSDILTLTEASIGHWPATDLQPLAAASGLARLILHHAPELTDLSALDGKDRLEEVMLARAAALSELAPLSSCGRLRRLSVHGSGVLRTVEGLRGSPVLEELSLQGCGRLEEVDALETVRTLKRLDLTGCVGIRQVEGVRELPALEEVVLATRRGQSSRIYQGADLDGLKGRLLASHAQRAALEAGDPMVTKVRKLLMHEDLYHQRQALEVMRSFGTDFIDEVLGDCRIEEDGELFTPFGEASESLLLTLAESGKVPSPLRRLVLRGSRFGRLDVLERLTDLEELELVECSQLGSLEGLERCQKLTRLTISHCHRLRDITALRWARSLESLSITGRAVHRGMLLSPPINSAALRALSTLVYLKHLDISGCGTLELGVLAKLTRLVSLKATALNPPQGLGRISHLKALEELEVADCEALEDVHALRGMPRLRRLLLGGTKALRDLEPVGSLVALEALNIGGEGIKDASALGRLDKLRFLALERCQELTDLGFLSNLTGLETLYLDGAPVTSLRALSKLSGLTRLTLQNLGELQSLDGIELCQTLETVEIETGCGKLRYADALLELPALKRLVLLEGDAFLVPPEDRDRTGSGGGVRVAPYRARLRAALNRRQHITREALSTALERADAEQVAAELADLEAFADPRLIDPLLKGTTADGSGRPRGGLLGGGDIPLKNTALVGVLRTAVALGHARGVALAAALTAPLSVVGGEDVVPAGIG